MEIKGILVSTLAPFENHIANGGEKLLGGNSKLPRVLFFKIHVVKNKNAKYHHVLLKIQAQKRLANTCQSNLSAIPNRKFYAHCKLTAAKSRFAKKPV